MGKNENECNYVRVRFIWTPQRIKVQQVECGANYDKTKRFTRKKQQPAKKSIHQQNIYPPLRPFELNFDNIKIYLTNLYEFRIFSRIWK